MKILKPDTGPELSIITVNYNNGEGLYKTMKTVFNQSFTEFEYIVIDGGSTDNSKELISMHADKVSYWISEKDKGVYDAMNKGIRKASGKYIMFLNSGDYLLGDDVLFSAVEILVNNNADIFYGNIELADENAVNHIQSYLPKLSLSFWENGTINHQASFIKASLFNELGLYDLQYSMAADYAFFLKAFVRGKRFHYLNQDMVHYRLDGISMIKKDKYLLQSNEIWNQIVPEFVAELYIENKEYNLMMQHRMMRIAKNFNHSYKTFKRLFIK